LSVQEPFGDSVSDWVSNDFSDFLDFVFRKVSSSSLKIDFCLLADKMSESSSDTLDSSKSVGSLSLTFDVGVEDTDNVLEFSGSFVNYSNRFNIIS